MSRKNRVPLADRVARAAEAALAAQHFVSAIDILVGVGWLDPGAVERWRRGQIDCLEEVAQADPPRISEAMRLFRSWATARGMHPSPAAYVGRTPARPTLRFSRDGNPAIEASYRTHWVSPELSVVESYFADHTGHRGIKAARSQYNAWLDIVVGAEWRNPEDIKASYPKASILKAIVSFSISRATTID